MSCYQLLKKINVIKKEQKLSEFLLTAIPDSVEWLPRRGGSAAWRSLARRTSRLAACFETGTAVPVGPGG